MDVFEVVDGDGVSVVVSAWHPVGEPVGMVHILHGWAEHAARYERLAGALTDAGWIVYADDHRGHGRTGERQSGGLGDLGPGGQDGVLLSVRDVAVELGARHPHLPKVLIGHSWGSFIAQRYLPIWGGELAGAALSGTTYRDPAAPRPARVGAFNERFEPGRTAYDWLSRDEAEVDLYIADPWCGFERLAVAPEPSPSGREVPNAGRIPEALPVLIINGSVDPVGGREGGEALAAHLRDQGVDDVELMVYEGGRHEMFNETNRDEVTADLLRWLKRRTG